MKVILNKAIGGWGYSVPDEIYYEYAKKCGITIYKVDHLYDEVFATVPPKEYSQLLKQSDLMELENREALYELLFIITEEYRFDPDLISIVENFDPEKTSLRVFEIPDDIKYYISRYDGLETLHEEHRRW